MSSKGRLVEDRAIAGGRDGIVPCGDVLAATEETPTMRGGQPVPSVKVAVSADNF